VRCRRPFALRMPLRRGGSNDPVLSFFVRIIRTSFLLSPLLLCPCESAERSPFLSRTFLDNFLFELATRASGAKAAETYFCLCTFIPPTRARVVTRLCISRVYIYFWVPLFFFFDSSLPSNGKSGFSQHKYRQIRVEQIYDMFELRNGFMRARKILHQVLDNTPRRSKEPARAHTPNPTTTSSESQPYLVVVLLRFHNHPAQTSRYSYAPTASQAQSSHPTPPH